MTEYVAFTVPGAPTGKGRPRFNRATGAAYTPTATRQHEGFVRHLAALAMMNGRPMEGPVTLTMSIYVKPPESWSAKRKALCLSGGERPTTGCDIDNIIKAIADACNGIVYHDDKQIVDIACTKHFGPDAKTLVRVETVDTNIMGSC